MLHVGIISIVRLIIGIDECIYTDTNPHILHDIISAYVT